VVYNMEDDVSGRIFRGLPLTLTPTLEGRPLEGRPYTPIPPFEGRPYAPIPPSPPLSTTLTLPLDRDLLHSFTFRLDVSTTWGYGW
jgi:hypothetical protein